METNSIILSLEKYQEFVKMENALKETKRLAIGRSEHYGIQFEYFTDSEIAKLLRDRIVDLSNEINRLKADLYGIDKEIRKIGEMNFAEFRRLKKTINDKSFYSIKQLITR